MDSVTRRDLAVFLLSVSLGSGIWLLAPAFTGQKTPWTSGEEPWGSTYYRLALLVAAVIPSALIQRRWWRWLIGIFLGQVLVTIPAGLRSPFGCLGWLYMFPYEIYCLPGVGVGALCGFFDERAMRPNPRLQRTPAALPPEAAELQTVRPQTKHFSHHHHPKEVT